MRRNNEERFADKKEEPKQPKQQQKTQTQVYEVPTDFVKLPSEGKFYPEKHPLYNVDEVEVSFMTTKQEDILVSPTLNKKGIALDRLVESIVVSHNVNAETLLEGDKNAIIVNARKNAYGDVYQSVTVCKECFEAVELEVDLNEVTFKELEDADITVNGTFVIKLPKLGAAVELKLYNGKDREEIRERTERKKKNDLPESPVSDNLRQMIASVDGNSDVFFVTSFIGKIPPIDTRYIIEMHNKMTPDIDVSFKQECSNCKTINEGGVAIDGNFFWFND